MEKQLDMLKFSSQGFKGVVDTTFRESQQSPLLFDTGKYRFTFEDKLSLIKGLIKLGVSFIELFPPVVNSMEEKDFLEIKKQINSSAERKVIFIAHCRCMYEDIKKAFERGFDGLNLYMSVSKIAQKYNYKKNFEEILKRIVTTVKKSRKEYSNKYLRFSVEDTFRTPMENIFKVYDLIYPYVDTLGMPDTVGISTPDEVKERVKQLKKRYPNNLIECHFHNDRGLALINSLTAIKHGANLIDTSIWGLGERSGITSLTGLLFNLDKTNPEYTQNFNLEVCYPLNIEMGSILDSQVPFNEPVSLTNRTHIAGVHQKAVINNRITYEGANLAKFGVNKNQILLGPLSGWNSIYYYLKQVMNYNISIEQAKTIASSFKTQSYKINRKFSPENLLKNIVKEYGIERVNVPEGEKKRRIESLS